MRVRPIYPDAVSYGTASGHMTIPPPTPHHDRFTQLVHLASTTWDVRLVTLRIWIDGAKYLVFDR
jgi:hypothetical protein